MGILGHVLHETNQAIEQAQHTIENAVTHGAQAVVNAGQDVYEQQKKIIADAQKQSEEIVNKAKAEAQKILADVNANIEQMKIELTDQVSKTVAKAYNITVEIFFDLVVSYLQQSKK